MKQKTMWAIKGPDGGFLPASLAFTRSRAWDNLTGVEREDPARGAELRLWRRDGFEAVRVKITVVR